MEIFLHAVLSGKYILPYTTIQYASCSHQDKLIVQRFSHYLLGFLWPCRAYNREVTPDLVDAFEEFAKQEHKKMLRSRSKPASGFGNEK